MIKVERPDSGDDTRGWGGLVADGWSSTFIYLNNEKRSITIDMRNEEERSWLRQFCASDIDVVIQNLRPGNADIIQNSGEKAGQKIVTNQKRDQTRKSKMPNKPCPQLYINHPQLPPPMVVPKGE